MPRLHTPQKPENGLIRHWTARLAPIFPHFDGPKKGAQQVSPRPVRSTGPGDFLSGLSTEHDEGSRSRGTPQCQARSSECHLSGSRLPRESQAAFGRGTGVVPRPEREDVFVSPRAVAGHFADTPAALAVSPRGVSTIAE